MQPKEENGMNIRGKVLKAQLKSIMTYTHTHKIYNNIVEE